MKMKMLVIIIYLPPPTHTYQWTTDGDIASPVNSGEKIIIKCFMVNVGGGGGDKIIKYISVM